MDHFQSFQMNNWPSYSNQSAPPNFDEFLNVDDDFFGVYLQQLNGQLGSRNSSTPPMPSNTGMPQAPHNQVSSPTVLLEQPNFQTVVNPLEQGFVPGVPSAATAQTSAVTTSFSSQPSYVVPSGVTSEQMGVSLLPRIDSDDSGSLMDDFEDDGSGKKKRRIRNPKQQVLNKLAQQRYREKRKQKYSDMEKTVEMMAERLATLEAVEAQRSGLERHNAELQALVRKQETELSVLKQQLVVPARSEPRAGEGEGAAAPRQPALDVDACRLAMAECIEGMRAVLRDHELGDSTLSRELPDSVVQELSVKVCKACQLCFQLWRGTNMKSVNDLLATGDICRLTRAPKPARQKWQKILKKMGLSKSQETALLDMRKEHVQALRDLYTERQRLNMMAMGLMLPHPCKGECADTTPEGKLECMEMNGYLFCMRSDLELGEILDRIKVNIKMEQRRFVELNYVVLHRLLTPVQAAQMMVEAYPSSIDALALANTLAAQLGCSSARSDDEESASPMLAESPAGHSSAASAACRAEDGACCPVVMRPSVPAGSRPAGGGLAPDVRAAAAACAPRQCGPGQCGPGSHGMGGDVGVAAANACVPSARCGAGQCSVSGTGACVAPVQCGHGHVGGALAGSTAGYGGTLSGNACMLPGQSGPGQCGPGARVLAGGAVLGLGEVLMAGGQCGPGQCAPGEVCTPGQGSTCC